MRNPYLLTVVAFLSQNNKQFLFSNAQQSLGYRVTISERNQHLDW